MKIDLTKLVTNYTDVINIDSKVDITKDMLTNSSINRLENVIFNGNITRDYDNNFILKGILSGSMILKDDITLDDVNYPFSIDIDEDIREISDINNNTIDILDYLYCNLLAEVPLQVRGTNSNYKELKGNGWSVITEEEFNNRTNNPFSNLSQILDK